LRLDKNEVVRWAEKSGSRAAALQSTASQYYADSVAAHLHKTRVRRPPLGREVKRNLDG
jgi:hypothetical protein